MRAAVFAEHRTGESLNSPPSGLLGETAEQKPPDPPRLPAVLHDDRHLCCARLLPGIHGLADYLAVYQRNERLLVVVIYISEIS